MSIPDPSHVSFPGPFMHHDVVVAGWRVPLLEAYMGTDERVTLLLDHRIGLDLTPQEAERVIPFLADAIAIALGYQYDRAPHPRPVRTMDIARIEPGDGEAAA
jgi:hypothetical protein